MNQATRDNAFNQTKEFLPVSLRSNKQLRKARQTHLDYWIWEENIIKRVQLECEELFKNRELELIGLWTKKDNDSAFS